MKLLRSIFSVLAAILLLAIIGLKVSGNGHLFKAIGSTYMVGQTGPSIDEFHRFPFREVEAGEALNIPFHAQYDQVGASEELMSAIEQYRPVSLAVLKDGELIYERYWENYSSDSRSNSFSMAKSIVGLSIGKCLELGLINSLDDKLIDYVPEIGGPYRADISLRHLLYMSSGINFDESYGNPLGFMAKAYYGESLLENTFCFSAEYEPGTAWKYTGGNTILLAQVVERTSGQDLSDFVSTHFWKPLGARHPALWSLDVEGGEEKAYCCFYSNALDFARLGQVVLDSGNYSGQQILDPAYITEMHKALVLKNDSAVPNYGLHWWKIQYRDENIIYARGILGQFIIAIPSLEMVVVRLGHERGERNEEHHPADVYHYIDLAYEISDQL